MMQAPAIGVDTLRLFLREWKVNSTNEIEVRPANFNAGTGETLGDCELFNGVRGVKAWVNRPLWNLCILPKKGNALPFVEFSIPRVASGGSANYAPVNAAGMGAAVATVENELRAAGFECNLKTAALSRVDVFRNVSAGQPFGSYAPLLSMMNGSRMHSKVFGSTFLWNNKAHALTVYDKREEMRFKGRDTNELPANAVRFEYRLLNGAKCKAALPMMPTATELVHGIDVLAEIYRGQWGRLAFGLEVGELELLAQEQVTEEMRGYRKQYGARWNSVHLRDMGALHISRTIGAERYGALVKIVEGESAAPSAGEHRAAYLSRLRGITNAMGDEARKANERAGVRDVEARRIDSTERKARRACALVRERARLLSMGRQSGKGITLASLYLELQAKVIG